MDFHNINNTVSVLSMMDNFTCPTPSNFNSTIIPDVFNRIPATFLINLAGFFILVILFILLRKKAWNYGRLALLHKNDNSRWMELFYGEHEDVDTIVVPAGETLTTNAKLSGIDNGYFTWIKTAFKITDRELLSRAGPDGLLYISFQRHLIILTTMMLFVSLFIGLPINLSGTLQASNSAFSHTTMSNLDPLSAWMWVHTIIILSYLPIGVFFMRKYMKQVHEVRPAGEIAARTLLISDIPKEYCNTNSLMQYFLEAFPTLQVTDITLAHDIQRLSELDSQRDCAEQARLYCENYNRRRESLKLYPHSFGQIIGCCCNNKIDALDFYTQEEIRLTALFEEEKKVSLSKPLGVAFVTLSTSDNARTMRRQLRSSTSNTWVVEQAPLPSDILWENLSVPKPCWYFNAAIINLGLLVFLFFATTPSFIVSVIQSLKVLPDFQNFPLIYSFSATLLLVSVAALMPVLVARSESLVRHWTKSGLNRAVMKKTLIFLLVMVLIFPSLGLTTAQNLFNSDSSSRLKCVFLADQGAFFVNYIITSALLGSALELVRFPELALYAIRLCLARSRAERVHVRKAVIWDFPLGAHYAWLLLVFTMTTVYSVACPLITPFGLLYLLLKHLVDRHNLCFAYGPSVGGGQLAGTATKALGVAPILTQVAFLSLGLVRRGLSPLAGVQLIGLTTSILGLVTGIILPPSKPKEQMPKRDLSAGHFVPPVLRKSYPTVPTEEIQGTSNDTTETTTPEGNSQGSNSYQNYTLDIC
ncbi:calcium permeable stress-gated cation channel 1 [Aphidius gifuensis]|nr:calcium permeable stress-gated cation channel 1 [Aphidius gifuensis]